MGLAVISGTQNNAAGTVGIRAIYTEQADTDLKETSVYIRVNGGGYAKYFTPATSPNGGGVITTDMTINIPIETNVIEAYLTAEDNSGNESGGTPTAPTASVVVVRDVTAPTTPVWT